MPFNIEQIKKQLAAAKTNEERFNILKKETPSFPQSSYSEEPIFKQVYALVKLACDYKIKNYIEAKFACTAQTTGENMLHVAARKGDVDFIRDLLSLHSDAFKLLDKSNKDSKYPMQYVPPDKQQDITNTALDALATSLIFHNAQYVDADTSMLITDKKRLQKVMEKLKNLLKWHQKKSWVEKCQVINAFVGSNIRCYYKDKPVLSWFLKLYKNIQTVFKTGEVYTKLEEALSKTKWDLESISKIVAMPEFEAVSEMSVLALIKDWEEVENPIEEKYKVLQMMLSKTRDINQLVYCDDDIIAPLWVFCLNTEDCSLIKFLIDNGARLTATDFMQKTVLHWIADYPEMLQFMLENYPGVDVNVRDADGKTPLHYVIESEDDCAKSVMLLYKHGARIDIKDNNGNTAFSNTAKLNNKKKTNTLDAVKLVDQVAHDQRGNNMLHHVLASKFDDSAKQKVTGLIEMGVDFGAKNKSGQSPLDMIENEATRKIAAQEIYNTVLCSQVKRPLQLLRQHYILANDKKRADVVKNIWNELEKMVTDKGGKFGESGFNKEVHEALIKAVKEKIKDPTVQARDMRKVLYAILAVLISLLVVTNVLWALPSYRNTMWNTKMGLELCKQEQALARLDEHVAPSLVSA